MIKIQSLSKNYGTNEVLKNVSMTFDKGKVYGIVGANGAGKSTFFRCIAGLESYEGDIISDLKPLKNHLGLLLTDPYFFRLITGREYFQLLCNARDKKNVDIDANNIFDLPLNQYALTYSMGMKKKLAVTAILLQGNDYFILDEPYNGVDIQSNIILTKLILKLKELNKIVLISSHIFSTLVDTCDELYFLAKGKEVNSYQKHEFEDLEELMKKEVIGNHIKNFNLK